MAHGAAAATAVALATFGMSQVIVWQRILEFPPARVAEMDAALLQAAAVWNGKAVSAERDRLQRRASVAVDDWTPPSELVKEMIEQEKHGQPAVT